MKRSGYAVAGVAVLATAAFLIFRSPAESGGDAEKKVPGTSEVSAKPDRPSVSGPRRAPSGSLPELPAPAQPPEAAGSPGNKKWADDRIEELEKLAWFDDEESLHAILAELYSPLPEIRVAALTAARSYGSSDAVPYLEQVENGTSDPLERKALADTIEYLKLPRFIDDQIGEPEPEN